MTQEQQNIRTGSRVCVIGNAKGTCWEYGFIADIKDNEALINYGTSQHPIFGMGIWVKISEIEVLEV